jgi:CDP-diacylglycerol--glycerol-3-phosphate 3-phosphatidyltransferase
MAAWLTLAGAAVAVAVLLVATRRSPTAPPPDRAGYLRDWGRLHGGYDATRPGLVRIVLGGVYTLARPLAAAGVAPNAVTLAGPVAAGCAALLAAGGRGERIAAAAVVAASGILDNLDGAVAVLSRRDSRLGYVLDSVVDRVSDGLWVLALWQAGAAPGAAIGAAATVVVLEYTRARAGAAGMTEVGVVTVAERPTRMLLVAFVILGTAVLARHASDVATAGAGALAGVTLIGVAQLARTVMLRLR